MRFFIKVYLLISVYSNAHLNCYLYFLCFLEFDPLPHLASVENRSQLCAFKYRREEYDVVDLE